VSLATGGVMEAAVQGEVPFGDDAQVHRSAVGELIVASRYCRSCR
jgi:hypothetical protein